MLKSIVMLLLSLADLAELASQRSHVVCSLMLFLLRPVEIAVRDYVESDAWPMEIFRSGDARADMVRLAMRLRKLACLLRSEAELSLPSRPRADARSLSQLFAIGQIARAAVRCMDLGLAPSVPATDTS